MPALALFYRGCFRIPEATGVYPPKPVFTVKDGGKLACGPFHTRHSIPVVFGQQCFQISYLLLVCFLQAHNIGTVVANQCGHRSEEHTSELQSLMRISYAVFCLKKKI